MDLKPCWVVKGLGELDHLYLVQGEGMLGMWRNIQKDAVRYRRLDSAQRDASYYKGRVVKLTPKPCKGETEALRKVAKAAEALLNAKPLHSYVGNSWQSCSNWVVELHLHNALAAWRNFREV